jgi:Putative zinc-finger
MAQRNPSRRIGAQQDAMTCQGVTAMIRDYLAGELASEIAAALEEHLHDCPDLPPSSILTSGPPKRYSPYAMRTSLPRCKAACTSSCGRRSSDSHRPLIHLPMSNPLL